MPIEVEQYIKTCGRCISIPLDLVCIDFLQIEPDSKGITNVLVITDHFTRYAQAAY